MLHHVAQSTLCFLSIKKQMRAAGKCCVFVPPGVCVWLGYFSGGLLWHVDLMAKNVALSNDKHWQPVTHIRFWTITTVESLQVVQ